MTRNKVGKSLVLALCLGISGSVLAACAVPARDSSNANSENQGKNTSVSETEAEAHGYVNIRSYGVTGQSREDCYTAFAKAALTGKSLYVPAGTYYVSKPIQLRNQNLYGDGIFQSFIVSTASDSRMPVLYLGRSCGVEDINIGFDTGKITGKETKGERPGIQTGDNYSPSWPLQRGSQINRVCIQNTGTAVYSPQASEEAYTSFSVAYTNLEIQDFSYRGFDFTARTRTGNVFSNIYMKSKYAVDSLFNMDGEESETTIVQLNLEHTQVKRAALSLRGCRALALSTLHIEGIELIENNSSYISLENTSGSMEAVSVYYTAVDAEDCSLLEIGDAVYDIGESWQSTPPATLSRFRIGTLHLKGLHSPNEALHGTRPNPGLNELVGFKFVRRKRGALGSYKFSIDNYVYYTFENDMDKYTEFATEGNVAVSLPD